MLRKIFTGKADMQAQTAGKFTPAQQDILGAFSRVNTAPERSADSNSKIMYGIGLNSIAQIFPDNSPLRPILAMAGATLCLIGLYQHLNLARREENFVAGAFQRKNALPAAEQAKLRDSDIAAETIKDSIESHNAQARISGIIGGGTLSASLVAGSVLASTGAPAAAAFGLAAAPIIGIGLIGYGIYHLVKSDFLQKVSKEIKNNDIGNVPHARILPDTPAAPAPVVRAAPTAKPKPFGV